MRKGCFIILIYSLSYIGAYGQFADNFDDGNFSASPVWTGSTSDWQINSAFQLQSNNTTAGSAFYLSTINTLATTAQWDFYSKLSFNTSGANYVDVFLISSSENILASSTTGYFVRIGNTDDEISLYRKDNGTILKIIDGTNGMLNSSNNDMRIRVIRNTANQWILSRDLTATGIFISEGTVTDATYLASSFFGIGVHQSTASFFQRHFFDDIEVKAFVPDVTPPAIVSATASSANSLDIIFNEPVDLTTSQLISNYIVNNGIGSPISAIRDVSNPSIIHLNFSNSFPGSINLIITVNGVNDLSGNTITNGTATFSFFIASQYSIIIDEIMADPSPVNILPDAEWIELKNTTLFDINLQGWKVGKGSTQSGPMPSFILKPDSFVVVTTTSAVADLSMYGNVISVTSFPALSNTGDIISLRSGEGRTIHSVNYSDAWYNNELKREGGWSLEMIDTNNPCAGSNNWTASIDIKGGTPSVQNSNDGINTDISPVKLIRAFATDSLNIVLVFNEPIDSIQANSQTQYFISDGIGNPVSAQALPVLFDRIHLRLTVPLVRNKIYTVTVSGVADCANNTIGTANSARVGLYEFIDSLDIIVNEILFNPTPEGTDYVELYNRSNKILSLRNVYIANRSTTGDIGSITQLSTEDYLIFPQDFIVITENAFLVKRDFLTMNPDAIIELPSVPSYNDDEGSVIILNEQGNIIDRVDYSDEWHFKLISNDEGVALERIDYNGLSNNQDNWHSAAASVRYGTPTYKNSQFSSDAVIKGEITVTPEIFSPDNDGYNDFAIISYSFPEAGYVTTITIFDAIGRQVRYLQKNVLGGIRGSYKWDGLGNKNKKLPVGLYIVYAEIFNLEGKTRKFKIPIVLAKRN